MLAVLQAPKPAALNAPFTLVYRATIRDVRPKAVKDAALADVRRDMAARVREGSLSSEAAAQAVNAFAKGLGAPPTSKTLTLSYDGRTLLIDEGDVATLLTRGGTLRLVKGPTDGIRGVWSPGVDLGEANVPFVGAHLPLLPPFRARSTRDARGAVVRVVAGDATTILSMHRPAIGVLVAGRIVRTDPTTRSEYVLVSAAVAALPADRFRPDRYVADGDEIAVRGRGNVIVDRKKGDLAKQIAALTGP